MKSEKFTLELPSVSGEIIVREGAAAVIREPKIPNLSGVLNSPLEWLRQRSKLIHHSTCSLVVDREKMTLTLTVHESDPYAPVIKGALTVHPIFEKFGINASKSRGNVELAKFLKMNRSAFADVSVAMKLVNDLMQFQAKVNKEIEKHNDNRGNVRDLKAQTVQSNLPDSFELLIPLFKGMGKERIEVEVYINPDDFTSELVSPVANDLIADTVDTAIDYVLKEIREIAPDLVIIEQ